MHQLHPSCFPNERSKKRAIIPATLLALVFPLCATLAGCSQKKGEPAKETKQSTQPKNANTAKTAAAPDAVPLEKPRDADGAGGNQDTPGSEELADPTAKPGSAQAQWILIGWKGGAGDSKRTQEQAKQLAEKVAKEAQTEKNFTKLVKKYSDGPKENGGKTAMMTESEASAVFKPVFKLEKGAVSKPIKGPSGYIIFKRIK
jgi:hypothetical protein